MFPLYPLWYKFWSWMDVGLCEMLFLHLLWFLTFLLLMWCMRLIDLRMREHTWNNLYTLKFVEVSFVPQYVINSWECSMCTWEECIFWFFGCNVLKMLINSNFSIVSFRISVALLIFCLENLSIDVGVGVSLPLWLYSHQFLLICLLVFVVCIWVLLY